MLQADYSPQAGPRVDWPGANTSLAVVRELCLGALLPYLAIRVGLLLIGLLGGLLSAAAPQAQQGTGLKPGERAIPPRTCN